MDNQTKGFMCLGLLTVGNILLFLLMVNEIVSVPVGMAVCFVWSVTVSFHATLWLMGSHRPWRRPSFYDEANTNNNLFRKGRMR